VLDHVGLNVSDIERSKAFYVKALAPLGYSIFKDLGKHVGFGTDRPDFWVSQRGQPAMEVHVCFRSPDRATVDAFYEAALAAGGTDNGPPGPFGTAPELAEVDDDRLQLGEAVEREAAADASDA
jgi:catechol 2,3-dioxygenase-like lactoylglutathione lyase family enzyme